MKVKSYNRANWLKKSYGISNSDYDRMFVEQDQKCKICRVHANKFKKSLSVDHCHKTGKVRGLLCYHCNWLIGHAKDNVDILLKAVQYLEESLK